MKNKTLFHNTIEASGAELTLFTGEALKQDARILEFFTANSGRLFTPVDVWELVFNTNVPITSVRRAMSNLTDRGELIKTKEQRIGAYGKNNFCWMKRQ